MGLKFVPDLDVVFQLGTGAVDEWGISTCSDTKTPLKCLIREVEDITPVGAKGGKQVIPSFSITFNGVCPLGTGDKVEVFGNVYAVLSKKPIRDLSRTVVLTKIKV